MSTSSEIIKRLKEKGIEFNANNNISNEITQEEYDNLKLEVEKKCEELLQTLIIDNENDYNVQDTPRRMAKMFLDEIFYGRYLQKPETTGFPNRVYDELYISGPITVHSMCSHHFIPIKGEAWVGIFPGENVIGLSKFNRLVDWIARRPQIQEEMTNQIADTLEEETQARGIGVIVSAEHMCMTHRGVKEPHGNMVTSVMRGEIRDNPSLKNEFLRLIEQNRGFK